MSGIKQVICDKKLLHVQADMFLSVFLAAVNVQEEWEQREELPTVAPVYS